MTVDGLAIKVLSLDDLIVNKRAAQEKPGFCMVRPAGV